VANRITDEALNTVITYVAISSNVH